MNRIIKVTRLENGELVPDESGSEEIVLVQEKDTKTYCIMIGNEILGYCNYDENNKKAFTMIPTLDMPGNDHLLKTISNIWNII